VNIVLYVNSFLPHIGGRELVVHYLALSLSKLGHKVRIIGPGGWWRYRRIDFGYPVYRYPLLVRDLPEFIKLAQLSLDVLLRGCDVIHAHVTYPCGYLAARLKDVMRVPLVITPHGADIHVIPEIGHGLRLNPLLEPKVAYALSRADALTGISGSVIASLKDAGAPAERIFPVPNGVDSERFDRGSAAAARQWLNLSASAKLLVVVGNYHPRKGHEVVVRALPSILEAEPEARLVIVGRGNSEVLTPLVESLGLSDKVVCPGQVEFPLAAVGGADSARHPLDRLADLYAAAETYISAGISEGAEGLSLALLEAMAAGLPPVASNVSGNRDIVAHGENGLLVAPGDVTGLAAAVLQMLGNTADREKMARQAKSVALAFSWQAIAQQYVDIYQSVSQ